jgi:hypothetical protein
VFILSQIEKKINYYPGPKHRFLTLLLNSLLKKLETKVFMPLTADYPFAPLWPSITFKTYVRGHCSTYPAFGAYSRMDQFKPPESIQSSHKPKPSIELF